MYGKLVRVAVNVESRFLRADLLRKEASAFLAFLVVCSEKVPGPGSARQSSAKTTDAHSKEFLMAAALQWIELGKGCRRRRT